MRFINQLALGLFLVTLVSCGSHNKQAEKRSRQAKEENARKQVKKLKILLSTLGNLYVQTIKLNKESKRNYIRIGIITDQILKDKESLSLSQQRIDSIISNLEKLLEQGSWNKEQQGEIQALKKDLQSLSQDTGDTEQDGPPVINKKEDEVIEIEQQDVGETEQDGPPVINKKEDEVIEIEQQDVENTEKTTQQASPNDEITFPSITEDEVTESKTNQQ